MVTWGVALWKAYGWFIETLGAPQLGFLQCYGLLLVFQCLRGCPNINPLADKYRKEALELLKEVGTNMAFAYFVLAAAATIHHFA